MANIKYDAPDEAASYALDDERRASPRIPCRLEANCQPLAAALGKTWSAQAVDISTGGICLVLGRRFEPGTMLSASLASADGETTRTLFLRVIHVTKHDGNAWRLGCAFASELTKEELQAFEIEAVRPEATDRRAWVRFACNVETQCRVEVPAESETWPGRVMDVSPGGMNLLAPRELAKGAILSVQLPNKVTPAPQFVQVRVLRVSDFSFNQWLFACEFTDPVAAEELLGFE